MFDSGSPWRGQRANWVTDANGNAAGLRGPGGEVVPLAGGEIVPLELRRTMQPSNYLTWVQRWETDFAVGATHVQRHDVWVPVSTDGLYAMYTFATRSTNADATKQLWQIALGRVGLQVHHTEGGATKTGTWTTSTSLTFPGGSGTYSVTAGDTIDFAIRGHTAVLRTTVTTNGGFAVVAIDGDFTIANRLPTFTADDFTAGLCRSDDVGRRYVRLHGYTGLNFLDIPLFEGLSDASHTVRFEVTGTFPVGGTPGRAYIASVVGCSSQDVGQSIGVGTNRFVARIEEGAMPDAAELSIALAPVMTLERNGTPGTFDFVGDNHLLETPVSFKVFSGVTDVTSTLVAGQPISASVVNISIVSTVRRQDEATAMIRRTHDYVMSAGNRVPCMLTWRADVLEACRTNTWYTLMLLARGVSLTGDLNYGRWGSVQFGSVDRSTPTDWNLTTQAVHHGVATIARVDSAQGRTMYAAVLDGGVCVDHYARSATLPVFWQGSTRKLYWSRVAGQVQELAAGQAFTGVVGWGILDRNAAQ
jgi:hypothetical protein